GPAAVLGDTVGWGEAVGGVEQIAQEVTVAMAEVGGVGDVLDRHDQHMRRCLGVDVAEGNGPLGAQHDVAGDVAGDDLAEQTIARFAHPATVTPGTRPWLCLVTTIPTSRTRCPNSAMRSAGNAGSNPT